MLVPDPRYIPNWPEKILFVAFYGPKDDLIGLRHVSNGQVTFAPQKTCVVHKMEGWMAGGLNVEIEVDILPYSMTEHSVLVLNFGGRDD